MTVVDTKEYFEYTPGVLRLYTKPSELRMLTAALLAGAAAKLPERKA